MSRRQRSGILPVEKGPGVTSFQVVAQLRRLLRAPKIGHGGTLDPEATGVLPILIGEATKLTPYLTELDKEYLATVRLGVTTVDPGHDGSVLETRPVPALDRGAIEAALARFVGVISQVPPMYSALRRGGRRLHELAREGITVEREPRQIMVHAITLEGLDLARADPARPVRQGHLCPDARRRYRRGPRDAEAPSRRWSGRAWDPTRWRTP